MPNFLATLSTLAAAWSAWICTKTHQADHRLEWDQITQVGYTRYVLYVRCAACQRRSAGITIGAPINYIRPFRPPFWWRTAETGLQKAYAGHGLDRIAQALSKRHWLTRYQINPQQMRSALAQFRSEQR